MMTSSDGNIFRVTGHLCGEFTGHRWIPHTKASDAKLWCFLWSTPEGTVENNRGAGDLRRHRADYNGIVMFYQRIEPFMCRIYVRKHTCTSISIIPGYWEVAWWRHQMETFSALLAICAGTGEFPAQRPVTRSFDVYFDLRLNKRLSKQWWGWWFEALSCSLWRHCNEAVEILRKTNFTWPISWVLVSCQQ